MSKPSALIGTGRATTVASTTNGVSRATASACLVAVFICLGCWLVGLVLPWYVNGLHEVPGAFWGGRYDPSDLWPETGTGFVPGAVWVAQAVGILLTPLSCVAGLVLGSAALVLGRRAVPRDTKRPLALLLVLASAATAAAYFSPFGMHLILWMLD